MGLTTFVVNKNSKAILDEWYTLSLKEEDQWFSSQVCITKLVKYIKNKNYRLQILNDNHMSGTHEGMNKNKNAYIYAEIEIPLRLDIKKEIT